MSDKTEEAGISQVPVDTTATSPDVLDADLEHQVTVEKIPWKYKKWFGKPTYYYASPKVQLTMVALVCFLCPGMFNALNGMGGGGKADPTLADNMVISLSNCLHFLNWQADNPVIKNTAVYSTFAVFGFFGGTFVNTLGVKLTLPFGGIGYCIYAISLLVSVHDYAPGFNIFAGALLGVCAGLLWTAQGTIMISYPHEDQKGRYFAWFWAIFNMGAVIGSLVRLFLCFLTLLQFSVLDFLLSPSQKKKLRVFFLCV